MFDTLARQFDDAMGRARARVAALDRAGDELHELRGRAQSHGGDVEAVADGRGALVSLWLAESVTRLPAAVVGALIVDTVHAAAKDALRSRQGVITDLVVELGG